jgi:hypothetical protein
MTSQTIQLLKLDRDCIMGSSVYTCNGLTVEPLTEVSVLFQTTISSEHFQQKGRCRLRQQASCTILQLSRLGAKPTVVTVVTGLGRSCRRPDVTVSATLTGLSQRARYVLNDNAE